MIYFLSLLLFCSTVIGGVLPFLIIKKPAWFPSLLAFSGSYLFSAVLLHMIPELFAGSHCSHHHHHGGALENPGLFLLLGFLLQLFLDLLGANVTHSHVDYHLPQQEKCQSGSIAPLYSLVPALLLHASLEGFLLKESDLGTFFAMLLHKLPVAFTLTTILKRHHHKRKKSLLILIIFSLATPLGGLLHHGLGGETLIPHPYEMWLSAMAIGSLFHVAATILFESNPHHQLHRSKWVAIFAGALLAFLGNHWIHAH